MNRHQSNRRAFTLVELLAVIAVLAILGTLLLPAISSVKGNANQATCASNMRQIGLALQLHVNDHGVYPETTHTTTLSQSWIYTIADYLEDLDEVRICPAEPSALQDERLAEGGTSYVLNSYVFVQERDPFGNARGKAYNRPSLLPNPSKTILAFNVSELMSGGVTSDHTHSSSWTGWNALLRDIQPNRHGGSENDSASGAANYLYADGHVESIPAIEVKQKITKGENIAAIQ
ncbi:prepilin-type N-terminal cleavage/methylation domain-containing protein [Cerasicoccus frondis]|uniref:prepilin-type N-terminal cleavage/methylation domain-containing protein n=1 Tax=Cerasicoccus frondis TaxID=490090 RepID=UPI002852AA54|nr:prepilin-type N-terminal cleavage/methylation domain-containing protein [Cerasicoccus frondis]